MPWTNHPPLDHIVTQTLPTGSLVQRCYHVERSPAGFWGATDVRFGAAPRRMLYTGDTDTAAVGETLLRDPKPYPTTNRIALPYDHVRKRGLATLRLKRDVCLLSLRTPAIHACVTDAQHLDDVKELIRTRRGYEETCRFARALLEQAPEVDVIAWASQRVDGHTVYCFYEGSVTDADFEVVDQTAFNTPTGYERLMQAVESAGLVLVRDDGRDAPALDDP